MRRSRFAVPGMALALALGGGLGGTALAPPVAATPAVAAHRSLPASIVAEQAGDDAIAQHYEQLGGSASFLGAAIGGTYDIAGGRAQDYTAGTIYWSPATGAHEVHGAIRARYLALGGPAGFFGFPLADETATAGVPGRYNDFAPGTVYWSPGTGAHEVHGAIRGEYLAFGGPGGYLGFPLTDETATPGGSGQYNDFERGTVYWSPGTGAHEVYGAIRAQWAVLGWERSRLGYPTSGEYGITGGRRNDFQQGSILWHAASGRTEVVYTSFSSALRGVDLERIPTTQKIARSRSTPGPTTPPSDRSSPPSQPMASQVRSSSPETGSTSSPPTRR